MRRDPKKLIARFSLCTREQWIKFQIGYWHSSFCFWMKGSTVPVWAAPQIQQCLFQALGVPPDEMALLEMHSNEPFKMSWVEAIAIGMSWRLVQDAKVRYTYIYQVSEPVSEWQLGSMVPIEGGLGQIWLLTASDWPFPTWLMCLKLTLHEQSEQKMRNIDKQPRWVVINPISQYFRGENGEPHLQPAN